MKIDSPVPATSGSSAAGRLPARARLLWLVSLAAVLLAACGGGSASTTPTVASAVPGTPAAAMRVSGKITIFAASSLTDAFNKEADAFKAANPGVDVSVNFGGSPALVAQLEEGAGADVLATADQQNMQSALSKGEVIDAGSTFAHNVLVIVVPKSNPGKIASPADLAKPGLKLVLAQEGVPVGTYARQSLARFDGTGSYPADFDAQVLKNLVSNEPNVKSVAAKVQLGEADAGIVYTTDVTPDIASDVASIPIPEQYNIVASYPIALTSHASNAAGARAFIAFVLSSDGQTILESFGFRRAS